MQGVLDVVYNYDAVQTRFTREALAADSDYSHWRYLPLLPLDSRQHIQPLQVGWTPLVRSRRLEEAIGISRLFIKDEGRNTTGSIKDRTSAVAVALALAEGAAAVACASIGNAASSLAGFAASAGLTANVFVPASAPEAKVTQLLIYGANVLMVEGTCDQAYDLSLAAAVRYGWYNGNCAANPYVVEGKKTLGFEMAEQLDWRLPDWVVMSVGDGCSIAGVGKALSELFRLGLIDRVPRLLGVQAAAAAPLTEAFYPGSTRVRPVKPVTLADSISIGTPRYATKALRLIRSSGGTMLNVTDREILDAMHLMARCTGIFAEPAGSAALAGLRAARSAGILGPGESAVICATGSGLKDPKAARRAAAEPLHLGPDLEGLSRLNHLLQP